MPTTDSIVPSSLLLKPVAGKMKKTDSAAKAGQPPVPPALLCPRKQKTFQLTDIHFAEEGYFKGSKYFKTERGSRHAGGVEGVPVPYTVSNDNTITALLLGCFVMAMVAFSVSRNFIEKQIRSFFHIGRRKESVTETDYEVRFQLFLIAQTALLASILYYFFAHGGNNGRPECASHLGTIGCFCGIFMGYFLLKHLTYGFVNWVFFDRRSNRQWNHTWLFLSSLEGVLLFPVVLLQVYFSLSANAALVCILIVMLFVKMLAFHKGYSIFFKRKGVGLQIILYFCALELMPLMVLWGILLITDNYLVINF